MTLPPALRLLAGRLPWCWGQCLRGSCGLRPLSAGLLNPWRTWSWRNSGLWGCWLWGTVVGCRAGCPHLGTEQWCRWDRCGRGSWRSIDGRPSFCLYLHAGVPSYPHVYSLCLRGPFVSPERPCVQMSWSSCRSPLGDGRRRFLLSCPGSRPLSGKSLPGPRGPLSQGESETLGRLEVVLAEVEGLTGKHGK